MLLPDADTCLCTRSVRGGSPAHRGTKLQRFTHINTSVPAHQGWLTCSHGYSNLHTAMMVIVMVMVNRHVKSMLNTGKDNAKQTKTMINIQARTMLNR